MVITADKYERTDGSAYSLCQQIKSEVPIVIVSWVDGFVFNERLLGLNDYVLVCFCEYGWNYEIEESHIWGANTLKNGYGDGRYSGVEWNRFDEWVKNNPPKIIFKRELLKKDVTESVRPIEYPCVVNQWPIPSYAEFNSRPINVFQYWGRSNECRLRIHSEIWLHSFNKGFQVCDNVYYIEEYLRQEKGERWVSLWIPHWARIDINQLLAVNNLSKLSLSWPGAGFKCFRTCEAPVNSVLVQHRNNFAWTFDWDDTNCILVEPNNEISGIEAALQKTNLYKIFINGVETAKKYTLGNYISHIEKTISERL